MVRNRLIRLRALRHADLPAAAALVAALPLWQRYHYGAARCARDLSEAIDRGDDLWLAARGSELLGLAWVLPRGGFGRWRYLKLLAVGSQAQGTGIGGRLLAAAERRQELLLLVSDFNRGARRFYARHGYRRIGALPGLVLPDVTEILMFKRATEVRAGEPRDRPPPRRPRESGRAPTPRAPRSR